MGDGVAGGAVKFPVALFAAAAIGICGIASSGCGAAGRLRDSVRGGPSSTPALTRTLPPTATATPRPALPPNPQGLLRWPGVPVHFCISDGGEGGYEPANVFTDAVERAFAAWGIDWRDDGTCGPVRSADGVSEIGWDVLGENASRRRRTYEAGLTEVSSSECTAVCDESDKVKLSEADITIDLAPPREFRSQTCLYGTMLHEAGHFLGLEHLAAPAVMAAETSACPTVLTAADRAALAERYGALAGA